MQEESGELANSGWAANGFNSKQSIAPGCARNTRQVWSINVATVIGSILKVRRTSNYHDQRQRIIMDDSACKYIGDDVLRHIVAAVNAYSPENSTAAPAHGFKPRRIVNTERKTCDFCGKPITGYWNICRECFESPNDEADR